MDGCISMHGVHRQDRKKEAWALGSMRKVYCLEMIGRSSTSGQLLLMSRWTTF